MRRPLPPEAPGFMPRRIGLAQSPSSYGFRALKQETGRLALEVIWAAAEKKAKEETAEAVAPGTAWLQPR